MQLGSGSISCVPHSKDNLSHGVAALVLATSIAPAKKIFMDLDKETGILY